MRRTFKTILPLSVLAVLIIPSLHCREPYNSPYVSPKTGYLVVEGYISGNTPTSFMLSRTIQLSEDTTNPQELGANVQVEGDDNSVYPLTEQGGGLYNTPGQLSLNVSVKYRLRVHTRSGGEYLSGYVPYKITPAIDSINWIENGNGVTIYVNAHDDAGNTRYYQWSYGETWEHHSAEVSGYEYVPSDTTVIIRFPQDQIYRCWSGDSSSSILIGTTDKLAKDVIYEQPLLQIPQNSAELTVLYSINARQYALTDSGYGYLSLMQKNTESLGTIFDAQPSELVGNIHCLSNSNEPVIGFISAGTVQQQRIFISSVQLTNWHYTFICANPDSPFAATPASFLLHFAPGTYIPLYPSRPGVYLANSAYCVDCTYQGGTTTEPPFWPN